MMNILKKLFIVLCIVFLVFPSLVFAHDGSAYDESQAIERDSKNAAKEAKEKNYEGAREESGKGFDTPTNPRTDSNEYDIPLPGEPEIDNE